MSDNYARVYFETTTDISFGIADFSADIELHDAHPSSCR